MRLAIDIIKLTKAFPVSTECKVISYQIIKSATSIAANYRAACRAKSKRDFIAKLGIVEEECDETIFWLELINESNMVAKDIVYKYIEEASALLSIFVASIKTAKKNPE